MSAGYAEIESKVKEMIDRAYYMDEGDERIGVLEEAVRLADTTNDVKLQYEARDSFIEASYFGGVPEKALVAYVWCLAQYDRAPEQFWEWKILWRYKWMINVICDFPQISKEQIYEMLDDMERRFRETGRGLRAVYKYRYRTERFFGNREEALKFYELAEQARRDDLTDCAACETDDKVSYRLYLGQDELALRIAEPLLDGRDKCRSVPQRTYTRLLVPLLRMGERERAWQYYMRAYQMISSDRSMLEYLSGQLIFLSLYGDLKGAARLLENHFRWTQENTNPYDRFLFYRAAWLFLETAEEAGRDALPLQMARTFPLYDAGGSYRTAELRGWFETRAREQAAKFDARNGTDYFTDKLLDMAAIKELETW
ncbi:MAG TPA: hypothetical protein VJS44_23265 [Pyrinomonadaceae bacterium]|nr:hypothetical protein [Pyrinomonadaceae bacterium]